MDADILKFSDCIRNASQLNHKFIKDHGIRAVVYDDED